MAHTKTQRPAHVKVHYRRMQFQFEEKGFDKYWAGSPFISLFWSGLSASFPPGEKFFIDSARALKSRVEDDPELVEEIEEFCKQEGHHTFQHNKFNDINRRHGLDIDTCQARYTRALDRARAQLDPMGMLSASMALEHFTSAFATQYLTKPHLSEGIDPAVRALWAWHAAEEAEHKATCYDLYVRLGGGYLQRVLLMPGAWFLLVWITLRNLFMLLGKEGRLSNLGDMAKGFWYLLGWNGLISSMVPHFFAYFRPGYHPWRKDDSALIADWTASNSQYIVTKPVAASA